MHDLSTWDAQLYERALKLLCQHCIVSFNSTTNKFSLSTQNQSIWRGWITTPEQGQIWWMSFATGIEILSKSALLKHSCLSISKKNSCSKNTSKFDPTIQAVYKNILSHTVTGTTNPYLNSTFVSQNIKYLYEIRTPTLGSLKTDFSKLVTAGIITSIDEQTISDSLECLADIRRNNDAHLSLNITVIGEICNDITNIYIPLSDLLVDIYHREANVS